MNTTHPASTPTTLASEPAGLPKARRFHLADAAVLIIATAAGLIPARIFAPGFAGALAAIRYDRIGDPFYVRSTLLGFPLNIMIDSTSHFLRGVVLEVMGVNVRPPHWGPWPRGIASSLLQLSLLITFPLLTFWTFAVLLLRLRSPRPPYAEMLQQPGFATCLSAAVSLAGVIWLERLFQLPISAAVAGGVVAITWLLLALGRIGHPERSWIDRFGRTVAVGWLAFGLIDLAFWACVYA